MLKQVLNLRRMAGFSLIELMVGMAAGLVLIGSVIGLVVANLQNNAVTAQSIRLNQESRAITEIITRELRRAGYDGSAMTQIGLGATLTTFNSLNTATAGCIKYAYDADNDGVADAGEFRMISRATDGARGLIRYGRFNTAALLTAASCTTGGQIISSEDINISALTFTVDTTPRTRIDFTLSLNMVVDEAASVTSTRTTVGTVMLRAG